MPKMTFSGEPGSVFTNDTGKVLFQFICNWHNSCGNCCQLDHMVSTGFPIPLHRGCFCKQLLIAPGASALPYVDFRAKIQELDRVQQHRVIGASNLAMVENGLVKWDDVVTSTRVRDFREVVARQQLDVKQMVGAGVSPRLAKDAYATVHTPAHELAAAKQRDLMARLEHAGVVRDVSRQHLAERLAARVGIGAGPSGTQTTLVVPGTPKPPRPGPAPQPVPKPGPGPKPLPPRRKSARPQPVPIPVPAVSGGAPEDFQDAYLQSVGVNAAGIAKVREARAAAAAPTPPKAPELPKVEPPKTLVERSVAFAKSHGIEVETAGYDLILRAYGPERAKDVHAVYEAKSGRIYLNERSSYWSDPGPAIERWSRSGFVSSSAEDHAIVHEVGHALHHRAVGDDDYRNLRKQEFGDEQRAFIKKSVSRYAATNPLEFTAEVFAGLQAGKQYDRVVMKFYDKIKGPKP